MKGITLLIVLSAILHISTNAQNSTIQNNKIETDFNNFLRLENSHSYTKGAIPVFNTKEATVGTQYLFNHWVNGSVTNLFDTVFSNPGYVFNYDKTSKRLLVTQDKITIIEIDLSKIRSFTLTGNDKTFSFERVNIINNNDFFQPLVKSENRFSLYKLSQTKFIAANYSTNGIAESGNRYDEYKDELTYYVILPGGKDFRKIELKKKSIRQALSTETSKVDAYFSSQGQDTIDEDFLKGLVMNLNQK